MDLHGILWVNSPSVKPTPIPSSNQSGTSDASGSSFFAYRSMARKEYRAWDRCDRWKFQSLKRRSKHAHFVQS